MAQLPAGFFARADGTTGEYGVVSPDGSIIVQSNGGIGMENVPISETPESPEIERAEQCTITHTFTMSYDDAIAWLSYIYRGMTYTEVSDGHTYYFMVLSIRMVRERGGTARLTIVSESKSFDTPPEEFSIVPVELGVNIIKHPRYFYAFMGRGPGYPEELKNQMVIRLLQNYFENTTAAYRDALTKLLWNSINTETPTTDQPPQWDSSKDKFPDGEFIAGTNMAKRAALEIIQKYWRGTETPYLTGWEMTYSEYFFRPPLLNPGGYIENPLSADAWPAVPEYFWSTTFPASSLSIFDVMSNVNPQCYSSTGAKGGPLLISWLRKADQIDYQRTWFKVTHSWLGTPIGHWDEDLYTHNNRPTGANDYSLIGVKTWSGAGGTW